MQADIISTFEQVKLWCCTIDKRIDPSLHEALKRHDLDAAKNWMERREFAHDRFVTTF